MKLWNLATWIASGTVPMARPLMYQPVVEAMMSTVPAAMFFIVAVVPDGYELTYLFSSVRYAQVFAQPLVGSVGSESPSR